MSRSQGTKSPKYIELAGKIQAQIKSGVLRPGDRLPTFVEMCAEYDVSPTTITNVYALLQQERLIVCDRGRGTFVASPPSKAPTGLIGVSDGSDMVYGQHPFAAHLLRGIRQAASKYGSELLLLDDASTRHWERVDGIIAHGARAEGLRQRLPADMPFVHLNGSIPNAFCVAADDRAGIAALMGHLLGLGHRRIASLLDTAASHRLSAYRDALYKAEIEPLAPWIRPLNIESEHEYQYVEAGHKIMKRWLDEGWPELGCTAIVTQNDDTARGVIEALREAGIRVPEDVSVTGFDGTEIGYFKPFLTTIKVPLEEMGGAAVASLHQQIADKELPPATLTLPVSLEVRGSTAEPGKATL